MDKSETLIAGNSITVSVLSLSHTHTRPHAHMHIHTVFIRTKSTSACTIWPSGLRNRNLFQEYRKDIAKTASAMAVAPLVISPADYEHQQKAYVAKAMQFSASVGITRSDLPQILIQKLDNWVATGHPDLSSEDAAAREEKKRPGDDQPKPAKKPRKAPAEKKRKK